jgi:hypothetical protein
MRDTLSQALRGLRIGQEQRQLAGQAIAIGVVVWIVVFILKEAVHWLFHEVIHWIEHAPTPLVLFISLAIGAVIVGLIARYRLRGVLNSKTKKSKNRAARAFRMAAQSVSRSDSALGAFYRRKRAQLGAPKAITATAHKIVCIFLLFAQA